VKFTVLIENTAPEGLLAEWGLSLLIEYRGGRYLLDTGGSALFAENARKLGFDLSKMDAAVLSHAHFDHSGGFDEFCRLNAHAPVYIRRSARENCYSQHAEGKKYIGLQRGMLKRLEKRLVRVDGDARIAPGVTLVPHKQPDMRESGRAAKMFVHRGFWFRPDDFSHEQSLVFETKQGLAVFNSCCHGGVDAIIEEISRTFPGKSIAALAGGFHLFRTSAEGVHALADRLEKLGAPMLYTGHCTGDEAMAILEARFPGRVRSLETGMNFLLADEA